MAQMHVELNGCLEKLQSLNDNPSTVNKDEAALRRYWVLMLSELLGVAKCRKNPAALDTSLLEARLLCKISLFVLSTMRPRRRLNAVPRPASRYNVIQRQVRRANLVRTGRK
eukprot:6183820-Pleurochrysis_carterae.AAC.6